MKTAKEIKKGLEAKIEAYEQYVIKCCYESRCNKKINNLESLCQKLIDEKVQMEVEIQDREYCFDALMAASERIQRERDALQKALDEAIGLNKKQASIVEQLEAELSDAKSNHQHTIDIAEKQKEQIDKLKKVVVRLNKDRNAAVGELVGCCFVCRWEGTEKCASCHFNADAWNVHESNWEWRGVKEDIDDD